MNALKCLMFMFVALSLSATCYADQFVTIRGQARPGLDLPGIGRQLLITGEILSVSPGLDLNLAKEIAKNGFEAIVLPESKIAVKNCTTGYYIVTANSGGFLIPTGTNGIAPPIYQMAEVVGFTCVR